MEKIVWLLLLLEILSSYEVISAFDNDLQAPLQKKCRTGSAIKEIFSVFDNEVKDRQYLITCEDSTVLSGGDERIWHSRKNQFAGELNFQCSNSYVCGLHSNDSSSYEDRIWSFECCKPPGGKICHFSIIESRFINTLGGVFNWETPSSNQFVIGLYSYYDTGVGDRRWKVYYGSANCTNNSTPPVIPPDKCACTGTYDKDWEASNVVYQLERHTQEQQTPEVVANKQIDNNSTKAESTVSVTLEGSVTETSTFGSPETSISINTTITTKVPQISVSLAIQLGPSYQHTWKKPTSSPKKVTEEFTVRAPPNTHAIAKALVTKVDLRVPCTITMKHKDLGCTCNVTDHWRGLQQYDLKHVIVDKDGNVVDLPELPKEHPESGVNGGDSLTSATGHRIIILSFCIMFVARKVLATECT